MLVEKNYEDFLLCNTTGGQNRLMKYFLVDHISLKITEKINGSILIDCKPKGCLFE